MSFDEAGWRAVYQTYARAEELLITRASEVGVLLNSRAEWFKFPYSEDFEACWEDPDSGEEACREIPLKYLWLSDEEILELEEQVDSEELESMLEYVAREQSNLKHAQRALNRATASLARFQAELKSKRRSVKSSSAETMNAAAVETQKIGGYNRADVDGDEDEDNGDEYEDDDDFDTDDVDGEDE